MARVADSQLFDIEFFSANEKPLNDGVPDSYILFGSSGDFKIAVAAFDVLNNFDHFISAGESLFADSFDYVAWAVLPRNVRRLRSVTDVGLLGKSFRSLEHA